MSRTDKYGSLGSLDLVGIGVASRIAGVTPDTLRRWERAGRIHASRTPGGQRMFRLQDIHDLLNPDADDSPVSA